MMSGPHETIAIPHAEVLAQTILALGLPMQHVFLGANRHLSFLLPSSGASARTTPMGKNNQTQNQDSELPAMVCLGGCWSCLGMTLNKGAYQSHSEPHPKNIFQFSGSGKQRKKKHCPHWKCLPKESQQWCSSSKLLPPTLLKSRSTTEPSALLAKRKRQKKSPHWIHANLPSAVHPWHDANQQDSHLFHLFTGTKMELKYIPHELTTCSIGRFSAMAQMGKGQGHLLQFSLGSACSKRPW